eukprot:3792171-Karenia_brevis.AAC.1
MGESKCWTMGCSNQKQFSPQGIIGIYHIHPHPNSGSHKAGLSTTGAQIGTANAHGMQKH